MNCPDCAKGWLHAAVITVEGKKRTGLVCGKCDHEQVLPREGGARRPLFSLQLAASNKPKFPINSIAVEAYDRMAFYLQIGRP